MPPKLRSKTTIESLDLGSDDAKTTQKGRVPAMVEQIENLIILQCNNRGIHPTTQLNKWKKDVQVMWMCLFFSL